MPATLQSSASQLPPWLHIQIAPDRTAIEIQLTQSNRVMLDVGVLDALTELRLPGQGLVTIDGRAPIWLTAALVANACPPQADIRLRNPSKPQPGWIAITGQAPRLGAVFDDQMRDVTQPPASVAMPRFSLAGIPPCLSLQVVKPDGDGGDNFFHPVCLRQLAETLATALPQEVVLEEDVEEIVINGAMPNWLAAALVIQIRQLAPHVSILLHNALQGLEVLVWRSQGDHRPLGFARQTLHADHPPTIIGIVGMPNVGKSVFSWRLRHAINHLERPVIRFDADAIAPTGGYTATQEGAIARRAGKRADWNDPQDSQQFAGWIPKASPGLGGFVIVDLPGGKNGLCVPPGREPLIRAVPHFIIVQGNDDEARQWQQAIAACHPQANILGQVLSRPHGHMPPPSDDPWTCRPELFLDRSLMHQLDAQVLRMAKAIVQRFGDPGHHP